ncbi:MAG: DUF3014 domain-containing protein [Variovorax sp.]|nr:MAG: DUF3014 domain-containing protein [Variovorax sp.]
MSTPSRDPTEFRPRNESSTWIVITLLVVLIAAGVAWWRWQKPQPVPAPPPVASGPQPDSAEPDAPAAASGPQNPIDALAEPDAVLPPLAEADAVVAQLLAELLGQKPVANFLQVDGFVRRAVATVDNLPRSLAPSRAWPVQPTPQRFTVDGTGDALSIAPDNAARYTAFVLFVESVDVESAVTLYARIYPLFQQAYEELGYPGRYFNDRLVAVLDHLLATPEPAGPLRVKLTEVKGDVASTRPWVRYEFVDPSLERLSSGQKTLVRMGPVNQRRLKARLAEIRSQVATGSMAKR